MRPATSYRHRGMTLIELLVVISILGLLAVAVIPNFTNTAGPRKIREAARAVSSFIAGGQSSALGTRAGGGVWIDPLPSTIASGTLSIAAAIDLAEANISDPYAGDISTSTLSFTGTSGTVSFTGANLETLLYSPNYLIRLGGSPTLYKLFKTDTSGTSGFVRLRDSTTASQTTANTTWPRPGSAVTYEIFGPPTRSTGNTLTLGNGVAIDVYHSWFQGKSLQSLLSSGTAPFQILFDPTGKPTFFVTNNTRYQINDCVYLLVASIESIQNSGTAAGISLAPNDGYWVAIDPRGGIPKVAEVYTSGTTIVLQQKYIREGAIQQGR